MKLRQTWFLFLMLNTFFAFANNVQVSNVRLTGQNTTDDFTMVEFDITWENSWRYANGPSNWDAAWIFIKYRVGAGGLWQHAWLNNTGHTVCGNATISNGFLSPQLPFNSNTNPSLGAFLYRSTSGSGIFSCQNVQLRWNYGSNTVSDDAQVDIKVFAIEMVYIPQGNFYVGSGGTELGAFYTYPASSTPYQINTEAAITVGAQAGDLYYNDESGHSGDQSGPIPAAYPKGYAAFYAMKYELSQHAYVDFLNTLTRTQQINRVRADITVTNPPNVFVMANFTSPQGRNGIRCRSLIPAAPGRVEFFCDLNNNGIPNESADGLCVPCNYMNYGDLASYLDWAGLRLMSEFEFEKCGRGPSFPVVNEFAWGSQMIYLELGIQNIGQSTEIPTESIANSAYLNFPVRVGSFARTESNRENAGAGYYGCMELSGNLFELAVSVGISQGRAYTGTHGNGLISTNGDADVANWPLLVLPFGFAYRGGTGAFLETVNRRLSHREFAALLEYFASQQQGGRGVRTAQ